MYQCFYVIAFLVVISSKIVNLMFIIIEMKAKWFCSCLFNLIVIVFSMFLTFYHAILIKYHNHSVMMKSLNILIYIHWLMLNLMIISLLIVIMNH